MKSVNIGTAKMGIDMKSGETEMPKGTMRDAVNVDLDNSGGFARRRGVNSIASFIGAHSLWSPASQRFALYAHADAIRRITLGSSGDVGVTTLRTGMTLSERVSYCEHGQDVVLTNGASLYALERDTLRLLGVADPAGPVAVLATQAGGMVAGRYGCAYSFVNAAGEESGLSPASFVELPASGGIEFKLPTTPDEVVGVVLYTTAVNSEVLYEMARVPAGLTRASVTDNTPGRAATNQFMHRMPGGAIVRMFRGRLLVARDDTLIFSEPFNIGLTSRRHNFIRFDSEITMVEAVDGGVYVGVAGVVYFLAGSGPSDFTQSIASMNSPVPYASTMIEAALLPADLERVSDKPVAMWLGQMGYSVGMDNGTVKDVQSERIILPDYEGGSITHCIQNGLAQIISVVQSAQSTGVGAALDSTF